MARLREVLDTETDLQDVSTYIASGNIVCATPRDPAASCATVRALIAAEFGVDTPVIHRTHAELADSEAAQPFPEGELKLVHAMFLEGAPAAGALDALQGRLVPGERLALVGHDLWIDYAAGECTRPDSRRRCSTVRSGLPGRAVTCAPCGSSSP